LKNIFNSIYKSDLANLSLDHKLDVSKTLLSSVYAEEKKFAIMLLRKDVKLLERTHLPLFAQWIDAYVYDWGTSDSLSSLFGDMMKRSPEADEIAKDIAEWKNASSLWRQRSSCVSFVTIAKHGNYNDLIENICASCIKNSERFVQLGVGWVLREVSLSDKQRVVKFIKNNYLSFSREGLRYAIEKMDSLSRSKLLNYNAEESSEEETEKSGSKTDSDSDKSSEDNESKTPLVSRRRTLRSRKVKPY